MSLFTAFALSIRNLFTKKGRTFLTAFAGSIGIIGIALILSLSNGFQNYINQMESDTLSGYPLVISRTSSSLGIGDLMEIFTNSGSKTDDKAYPDTRIVYSDSLASSLLKKMRETASVNDLVSFKKWVDENEKEISSVTNAVSYGYHTEFSIYTMEESPSGEKYVEQHYPIDLSSLQGGFDAFEDTMNSLSVWEELVDNQDYLNAQYDLIEGRWPTLNGEGEGEVFDVVLSVDRYNRIYDYLLYAIGLMSLEEIFSNLDATSVAYSFDEIIGKEYKILLGAERYEKGEDGVWKEKNAAELKSSVENSISIRIAGIIRPKEGVNSGSMGGVIGYSSDLTKYIIRKTNSLQIVKDQLNDLETNVLTGQPFTETESVGNNLSNFGVADLSAPSSVRFYVKGFEEKTKLINMIDEYNASVAETEPEKVIKYNDTVGALMSSVNTIVNAVSYVLIAFVSISLIVSSIMIGIITYISVLERTKEIGVLRSIGASKRDISRLFNAETLDRKSVV